MARKYCLSKKDREWVPLSYASGPLLRREKILAVNAKEKRPQSDCSDQRRLVSQLNRLDFGDEPSGVVTQVRGDHVEHGV